MPFVRSSTPPRSFVVSAARSSGRHDVELEPHRLDAVDRGDELAHLILEARAERATGDGERDRDGDVAHRRSRCRGPCRARSRACGAPGRSRCRVRRGSGRASAINLATRPRRPGAAARLRPREAAMIDPYPPIEPYDQGHARRRRRQPRLLGDLRQSRRQARARRPRRARVGLRHGRTGGYFDPDRYRIVLFDQRGCGRSTPHASDPAHRHERQHDRAPGRRHGAPARAPRHRALAALRRLVGLDADPRLRRAAPRARVGDRHPRRDHDAGDRRSTGSTAGVGRFFPEEWDAVPRRRARRTSATATSSPPTRGSWSTPDADVRARATADWLAWEDAVISLEPNGIAERLQRRGRRDAQLAFVRICTHYFSHGAWLEEGALLRDAGRLAGIPGVLIHGRLDMGSPARDRLGAGPGVARTPSWSSSTTQGTPAATAMRNEIRETLARFAGSR